MIEKPRKRGRPPGDHYLEDSKAVRRMHELRTKNKGLSISAAARHVIEEMNIRGAAALDRLRTKYRDYVELLKKSAADRRALEETAEEGGVRLPLALQSASEGARYRSSPEGKSILAEHKRLLLDPQYRRVLSDIKQMRDWGLLRDAVAAVRSVYKRK
jgi:hypothetical protein